MHWLGEGVEGVFSEDQNQEEGKMRLDRVAVKAKVVYAMALLGWISPTSAEPSV